MTSNKQYNEYKINSYYETRDNFIPAHVTYHSDPPLKNNVIQLFGTLDLKKIEGTPNLYYILANITTNGLRCDITKLITLDNDKSNLMKSSKTHIKIDGSDNVPVDSFDLLMILFGESLSYSGLVNPEENNYSKEINTGKISIKAFKKNDEKIIAIYKK